MQPLSIAVLHGGPSSEHDISVWSSQGVLDTLRGAGHQAAAVYVDRAGSWHFGGGEARAGETVGSALPIWSAIGRLADLGPAVCFMGFHGTYGEDGRVQAALDLAGLRYTGSGCTASAVAMDKPLTRRVFSSVGVPVAAAREVNSSAVAGRQGAVAADLAAVLGLPVVVKVPAGGSSVGVEIARDLAALEDALSRLAPQAPTLLCEAFVAGVELTAGVLEGDDGEPVALPVVEIVPKSAEFFDFDAKYRPGGSDEIVPARISADQTAAVQAIGLLAHRALGCRGVSRTDVILGADGAPVALETNTLPGLTPASLLPKAAAAVGYSYLDLLHAIVAAALRS